MTEVELDFMHKLRQVKVMLTTNAAQHLNRIYNLVHVQVYLLILGHSEISTLGLHNLYVNIPSGKSKTVHVIFIILDRNGLRPSALISTARSDSINE